MTVQFTLDGTQVTANPGETVFEVARRNGIGIPTLCQDDRLDPSAGCRMCLVEVEGQGRLQPSCAMKPQAGMVVNTDNDRVLKHRQVLLTLYLADVPTDDEGLPFTRTGQSDLRDIALAEGVTASLDPLPRSREGHPDDNPYVDFDADTCIGCARCVRYCDEVVAANAITMAGRGATLTVTTPEGRGLNQTSCELCGGCIDTCPTGAMASLQHLAQPITEKKIRTTCNFCGTGCSLDLHVTDGKITQVTPPPPGETLNDGNLCVKGRFAMEFVHHPDRLTDPMIRGADGELRVATWPEAIQRAADGLRGVQKRHGTHSLGFISSSRCTGEENYLVQKLSRAAFGTNNCHQCAAT